MLILIYWYLLVNNILIFFDNLFIMCYSQGRKEGADMNINIEMNEIELQRTRLAERLKEYRKRIGLTQLELADKVGRSQSVISSWEIGTGVPDAYYLPALAKALNVSVADICGSETTKSEDVQLLDAFHRADSVTKRNVRLLLGLGGSDNVDK